MSEEDQVIQTKYREAMQQLAADLDQIFNGRAKGVDRQTCFVLLISPFMDIGGRCNYISNGERKDVVAMMKEVITRFESQPEMTGTG
jgi:hypothetical protein